MHYFCLQAIYLVQTRIRFLSSFVILNWMDLDALCKYWSRRRLDRFSICINQKAGKLRFQPKSWKLFGKHFSHKYLHCYSCHLCCQCVFDDWTDAGSELVHTRDGTEVCNQCSWVVVRWLSCPRVIPDVHVSFERVDTHVSKGLIVCRKWRVNRWAIFILTVKETRPSGQKVTSSLGSEDPLSDVSAGVRLCVCSHFAQWIKITNVWTSAEESGLL